MKLKLKVCPRCKVAYPYIPEFFYRNKEKLDPRCKQCFLTDYARAKNARNNPKYQKIREEQRDNAWVMMLENMDEMDIEDFVKIEKPRERDFRNFLAGAIHRLGFAVSKEQVLEDGTRIDLTLPDNKIGIEVKLTKTSSTHSNPYVQRDHYAEVLGSDWVVHLVSLDGSIGNSFEDLKDILEMESIRSNE